MSDNQQIQELEERFARGEISRREFMIAVSALGVTFALGISPNKSEAATATVALSGTSSGFSPYVEDVFSTFTYTGTGSTQTIENGINLRTVANAATLPLTIIKINRGGVTGTNIYNYGLAIDSSGNFLVNSSSNGGTYGYLPSLTKIAANGTSILWQKQVTDGAAYSYDGTPVIDSANNIYVKGADYSGGYQNILVAKYNSSGTLQWSRSLSPATSNNESCPAIALDSNEDIIIGGDMGNTWRAFLMKLSKTDGSITWQRELSLTYGGSILDIVIGVSGDIYAVGTAIDSVGPTQRSAVIFKYNSSGALQWQRQLDVASDNDYANAVTRDASDNIYVAGTAAPGNGFIAKYNSSGTLQWAKNITGTTSANRIVFDGTNLWVSVSGTNLIKVNTSGTVLNQYTTTTSILSSNKPIIYGTSLYCVTDNYILSFPFDGSAMNGFPPVPGVIYNTTSGIATATASLVASTPTFSDAAGTFVNSSYGTSTTDFSRTVTNLSSTALGVSSGGMVWTKGRGAFSANHGLVDTARGTNKYLASNNTDAEGTGTQLTSFDSTGYTLGAVNGWEGNWSGRTYASWTFRKASKFFDVVTYTGNGVDNTTPRQIAHSLGCQPGVIIIKNISSSTDWFVLFTQGTSAGSRYGYLNSTTSFGAAAPTTSEPYDEGLFGNGLGGAHVTPTASHFTVAGAGTTGRLNTNGQSYVAYLFAHDATANGIVRCGTISHTAGSPTTVTLGWEPQFVLHKFTTSAGYNWEMEDTQRGMNLNGVQILTANSANAETTETRTNAIQPTATGFSFGGWYGTGTYAYMAIRRGPMRTPTAGTQVFQASFGGGSPYSFTPGFPVDMAILGRTGSTYPRFNWSRLWGDRLDTAVTDAQVTGSTSFKLDSPTQTGSGWGPADISWNFRRAPSFFDQVCFTSTSLGASGIISHNLGVMPDLLIAKSRDGVSNWVVFSSQLSGSERLVFNLTDAKSSTGGIALTSTSFSLTNGLLNFSSNYVAYLFATCPGVSKIATYTGNGSSTGPTTSVGFQPRFLMVKRIDSTGNWVAWDSTRSTSNPRTKVMFLNSQAAETTSGYDVDFNASTFQIKSTNTDVNANGGTYLYFAIS